MRAQEIVERGLALLGPDRGTVIVEQSSVANLRWANSSLTTNGLSSTCQVHVAALPQVSGGRAAGAASAVVSSAVELADLVAQAQATARQSGPAQDEADEVPARPVSPGWDEPPAETSPAELAPVSALLGSVFVDRSIDLFGYAEHSVTTTYLGTSSGLRLRHDQPAARFELCGKSAGRSRSAWAGRSGRYFVGMDLADTPDEVRKGLAAQATRVDVQPGRHRVLLSPSAVADLLVYLMWSASARDAVEGRSAFSAHGGGTRVGERFTSLPFWLSSDPTAPGLECAPHVESTTSSADSSAFDTGLPLAATDWFADGRCQSLITTRHSAALAGLPSTPYVDNLIGGVGDRSGSLDELAARVGDGLLVTSLWYIREVDAYSLLLTGLTRDGVYLIEDGEVSAAVNNFRFNESPLDLLRRATEAGRAEKTLPREWGDWFNRASMPSLRIPDFHMSSVSQAQ